jgi:hypothetical protein
MTELPKEFKELWTWLKPLCRYHKLEDIMVCDNNSVGLGLRKLRLHFFTKDHQYFIAAHLPEKGKGDGYLGCIVKTRKPRAGEDWNRGSDLVDGSYTEATFREILNDIVAYELVKVVNK